METHNDTTEPTDAEPWDGTPQAPDGKALRIWKRGRSPDGNDPNKSMMRRRATLPHPLECSTIAAPGLSYRVRNGTGRLTWAMTAAKPETIGTTTRAIPAYHPNRPRKGPWRPGNRTGDANKDKRLPKRSVTDNNAYCRREPNHRGTPRPHPKAWESRVVLAR